MDQDSNPAAQGQSPATDGAGNTSQEQGAQQAPDQHSGFQKRIDQLTAERREAERREETLRAQVAELTNSVIQQAQRREEAPPPPPVDITPEEKAKLDYLLLPTQKKLQELEQQHAAALGQIRFQQAMQGKDPRIVQRAQELLADWRKDPSKGGWTPEDALVYASGQLGIPLAPPTNRDERGRFNGAGGVLTHQNGAPPIPNGNPNAGQEPDWNTTSPEKLAEFYGKRLEGKTF